MHNIIELIPDTVWLRIFKYLSLEDRCLRVRLTCQKWNIIINDPTFWAKLDFSPFSLSISDEMVQNVLRKVGQHVKHISFRHCLSLSNYTLSLKMFRLEQLQYVDVSFTSINDEAFYTMCDKHCEITDLRWRDCKNIKHPGKALGNFSCLNSLEVESTRKHALVRKLSLSALDLVKVVQRNPGIQKLAFTSSWLLNKPGILSTILPLVGQLKELSVTFLSDTSTRELAASLNSVPYLRVVCLPFHPDIISSLASNCKQVRCITFNDLVTSLDHERILMSLNRLFESCKSLRSFSINANYYCSGVVLGIIAEHSSKSLESLELHMGIVGLSEYYKCFQLCPMIKDLSLFLHAREDHVDSLFNVVSTCLPQLRTLHLANVAFTMNGFENLLRSCTQLESIVLSGSKFVSSMDPNITTNSTLNTNSCNLKHLSFISPKDSLDESVIIAVLRHCPKLQGIMVEGLSSISNELIRSLAESCSLLKGLNIPSPSFGTPGLLAEAVQHLCKACPQLHSLTFPYSRLEFGDTGAFDVLLQSAVCLRKFSFWLNSPDDVVSAVLSVKAHRGHCTISSANKERKEYDVAELYRTFDHQDYISLLFPAKNGFNHEMPRSTCIGDSYFLF